MQYTTNLNLKKPQASDQFNIAHFNDNADIIDSAINTNSVNIGTNAGTINAHIADTANPHGVTKTQVGLGSVVNTGDSATPTSGGTAKFTTGGAYTELAKKVDKVAGKGLSTNDFTTTLKNKLDGIASGAQVNTITGVKGDSESSYRTGNVNITLANLGHSVASAMGLSATGLLPANIATANAHGVVCSTAAATQAKTVAVGGFALFTGATVRVLFSNGNTASNPTLNVESTGAKSIKAYRNGSKVSLTAATVDGSTKCFDVGTTLELIYDGTDWVIMGNPVLLSMFGPGNGYIKYANGLLIQWRAQIKDGVAFYFPIAYSTYATVIIARVGDAPTDNWSEKSSVQPLPGQTGSTIQTGFIPHFDDVDNSGHYLAIGY